ncbi:MAG: hypothetical protein ACREA9_12460 [Pyrinomonadaceae bacterium]
MEDRYSVIKALGIPEPFAATLLIFSFVLFLSPYLSGHDFGIFKIPIFSEPTRNRLKLIGPVVLVVLLGSVVPLFHTSKKTEENLSLGSTTPNSNQLISDNRPSPQVKEQENVDEASIAASSPSFSPVTLDEFLDTMWEKPLTSLQREDFLQRQLGKRVIWEGYVLTVSEWSSDRTVSLAIDNGKSNFTNYATFSFPAGAREDLLALKPRQLVKVTGVLKKFDSIARLDDCRILKIWPLEEASSDRSK